MIIISKYPLNSLIFESEHDDKEGSISYPYFPSPRLLKLIFHENYFWEAWHSLYTWKEDSYIFVKLFFFNN